eukprot:2915257-Pleurochrysis_carterae.AAC.1
MQHASFPAKTWFLELRQRRMTMKRSLPLPTGQHCVALDDLTTELISTISPRAVRRRCGCRSIRATRTTSWASSPCISQTRSPPCA